jgi:MYXO-CTERM domain-containing protein
MGLTNFPHLDLKGYIVERTTDPNPVPAPPAMALFVVGLLGLAAVRLRRA